MVQYRDTQSDQALSSLFDLHSNKLYYFLLVMSDAATAEDIAQKVWVTVIEKRHQFVNADNFQAWLFTIARRALIDEFRRNARIDYDSDVVSKVPSDNIDVSETLTKSEAIHSLLCALPLKQKEALSLQLEGFSLEQISAICHVPRETIKTRLRYARDTLKKMTERD
jgi:RNA polymerase sigma-70 factor (ECF subfamily)